MKSISYFQQILCMISGIFYVYPQNLWAQGMMDEKKMSCPMCGVAGWGGMILGGILILSVVAALIALTVFLIRKSRSQ